MHCKVRQLIQNGTKIIIKKLLQGMTEVYYKLSKVLKSVTDCYYKVLQVL